MRNRCERISSNALLSTYPLVPVLVFSVPVRAVGGLASESAVGLRFEGKKAEDRSWNWIDEYPSFADATSPETENELATDPNLLSSLANSPRTMGKGDSPDSTEIEISSFCECACPLLLTTMTPY